MNRTLLFALACVVSVIVGCSQQPNIKRVVEYAAMEYAFEVLKLAPEEYEVRSIERKKEEGIWLVIVSQVPEVPSGDYFLAVTDDGIVEDYFARNITKALKKYVEEHETVSSNPNGNFADQETSAEVIKSPSAKQSKGSEEP